jgi:hypothetical protein
MAQYNLLIREITAHIGKEKCYNLHAEENLSKEETEFLSTHSQMTNLQNIGKV